MGIIVKIVMVIYVAPLQTNIQKDSLCKQQFN